MQLGFVIDQSRCIGCHACTVACKSENSVPVGSFRTWVKYVEDGEWPIARRSFAVLRCNQCTDAPCVTICPVNALEKRDDGVVDVDPKACIGCKACMQGCPYDALYLNDDKGTVEKCHFCVHRTEQGLAPACAVVCPTEAIVPGDFHDPDSEVSRLRREHELTARKVRAGTGPNVLYREGEPAALDPTLTRPQVGSLWGDVHPGAPDEALLESLEERAGARTAYDVTHPPAWGGSITGYLFAKSVAAGAFLAGAWLLSPLAAVRDSAAAVVVPAVSLVALAITCGLLVADLKRPERFLFILLRPNWDSWLARGTFLLAAHGLLATAWLVLGLLGRAPSGLAGALLLGATVLSAALAAAYTGWLFRQARGRPLWMQRGLWAHLLVQAVVAGAAVLLLVLVPVAAATGEGLLTPLVRAERYEDLLRPVLLVALLLHGAWILVESRLAPRGREAEYRDAMALLERGPLAYRHWAIGLGLGVVAPVALLAIPHPGWPMLLAAVLALAGLAVHEHLLVRAGQAVPIS